MAHLQMVFQSLGKFYPSAPETNLSSIFLADPHLYSSITSSSLLPAKWVCDEVKKVQSLSHKGTEEISTP